MTQARINDVLNVANEVQETEKQLVAVSSLRWAECEVLVLRTGLPWDQAELGGAGGRGLATMVRLPLDRGEQTRGTFILLHFTLN